METLTISNKATKIISMLNEAVSKSITGLSFVSIRNYTNSSNEVSHNLINIGIRYESAKAKDIEFLQNIDLSSYTFKSEISVLEEAKNELIASFIKPNENRSNGQIDAYTHIVSGLKVHNETGLLYIYGYRENKTILVEGEYKKVNSSPLTIAKNELRRLLKTGKFTQYAIEVGNTINANKQTLEL
jgi:hypothetical protein